MSLKGLVSSLKIIGWRTLQQTHRADSCIAATALCLAALHQRGYTDAYPLVVRVSAVNAAAAAIIAAHPDGVASPEVIAAWKARRAKLVIIGAGDEPIGTVNLETGRFVGHLVAVVPPHEEAPRGFLIDLSIGQATRPDFGLHLGPFSAATSPAFLAAQGELSISRADGSHISYEAFPSIDSYTISPDWQRPERIAPAVAATLAALA